MQWGKAEDEGNKKWINYCPGKKCTLGIGPMTNKLTKQAIIWIYFSPISHKIRQYCGLPPTERPLAVWSNENSLRDSSCKAELQRLGGSIHDWYKTEHIECIFRSYQVCKFIKEIQGTALNRFNISFTNRHICYEASSGRKAKVLLFENSISSYVLSCPVTVILAMISLPLLPRGKKSMVLLDSLSRNDILAPSKCFSLIFPEKKCYYEMTNHKVIKFEPCCPSSIKFCKILDVSDMNFTEDRNLTETIGPNSDSWRKSNHSFAPLPLKKSHSTTNQHSCSICWNHKHDIPNTHKTPWKRLKWMVHLRNMAGSQSTQRWGLQYIGNDSRKSQVLGLLLRKQLHSHGVFPSHCT